MGIDTPNAIELGGRILDTDVAVAVAASILAFTTAVAAWMQAYLAASSNKANFFVEFSRRYTDDEMRRGLQALAQWHRRNKNDPGRFHAWVDAKTRGDEDALALNRARRLVSRYYYDVAQLYELGLIRRAFARAIISNNGLNIFYQICDPMNQANQPVGRLKLHCDTLRRLRRRFGDGDIFDSGVHRRSARG